MSESKPRNFFSCDCESLLAHMLERSGQRLMQQRAFLQYSLGSAGLFAFVNPFARGDLASAENAATNDRSGEAKIFRAVQPLD